MLDSEVANEIALAQVATRTTVQWAAEGLADLGASGPRDDIRKSLNVGVFLLYMRLQVTLMPKDKKRQ